MNRKINILLIDDQAWSVFVLRDILQTKVQCNVSIAENCYDAIQFFEKNNYDIVVSDLLLPIGAEGGTIEYEYVYDRLFKTLNEESHFIIGIYLLQYFLRTKKKCRIIGMSMATDRSTLDFFEQNKLVFVSKLGENVRADILNFVIKWPK